MYPLISVVIPNYNGEKDLEACLRSVCTQDYPNLQILLVDDGSTDGSHEIYRRFCDQYTNVRLITQTNQGLSAARNTGLEAAEGELLTFVDSDDLLEPGVISALADGLQKYDADIAVCGISRLTRDRKEPLACLREEVLDRKTALQRLAEDKNIKNYAWGKLYRRELFEGIRYPAGKKFEDIPVTWQLFARSRKVAAVDMMGYIYRMRKGSLAHTRSVKTAEERLTSHMMRFEVLSGKQPDLTPELLRQLIYAAVLLARAGLLVGQEEKKSITTTLERLKEILCTVSGQAVQKLSAGDQKKYGIICSGRKVLFRLVQCDVTGRLKRK